MTSHTNIYCDEQYIRGDHNDGNTSDDALILMADDGEDRTPLLNNTDNGLVTREEILSDRSRSPSAHCHVPDDTFDYGSRNRLILVLIICIIFMIIEIVGMFLHKKIRKKNLHNLYISIGGVLSNSTAVVTDAAHMAIDVASFLISLTAMYLATKRPTQKLSFGYIRAGLYIY